MLLCLGNHIAAEFINYRFALIQVLILFLSVLASVFLMCLFHFNYSNMAKEDERKNIEHEISPGDLIGQIQDDLTLIGTDLESNVDGVKNNAIEEMKRILKQFIHVSSKRDEDMEQHITNNNKNIVSLKNELDTCSSRLQRITKTNAQSYTQKYLEMNEKYKKLQKEMLDIKEKLEQSSNSTKKVETTSFWVHLILVCMNIMLLGVVVDSKRAGSNRNTGAGILYGQGNTIYLEKIPTVVSFKPSSSKAHRKLADLFLDGYDYKIVCSSQDASQIRSRVVYVFVDFNERNIILESDAETHQIKRETVEIIKRMGGTPVVIYRLHSESSNLEDTELYSDRLTSVQSHLTLQELSANECMLSIDKEFTEYQRRHLQKLLKK